MPYTPEQNGSSERENRTIVEAAKTMIHSHDLQLSLWAEAVNAAVYVLNRTGTSTVKNKTPYDLWHEKTANVDNLRVFGSFVYTHIPKQKRHKFDRKATKCIFVGYSEISKGFRVYNPDKQTIEVVRDVNFERNCEKSSENNNDRFVHINFEDEQYETVASESIECFE